MEETSKAYISEHPLPGNLWQRMTVDEYAEFEKANGTSIIKVDGIWWRKVRPLFYRPLFPFLEIIPNSKKTLFAARVGGYQHAVPNAGMANSCINLIVWDDVHEYSIDNVKRSTRSNIRTGMRHFKIKQIKDRDEFISEGYPVYLSFYDRTKYEYKKERTDKRVFAQWAEVLFSFPKVVIYGAYYNNELSAIDISYLIEDVLFYATSFSKTEHMRYQVLDLMIHTIREKAAACANVQYIYIGLATGERGLDKYKLGRGAKVHSKPAYYHMNPAVNFIMREYFPREYSKVTGNIQSDNDQQENALAPDE